MTIYQNDDNFLPREDAEDAEAIHTVLKKAGVVFAFEANAKKIADTADGVALTIEQNGDLRTEEFDEILIATGRVPNTDNLDAGKCQRHVGGKRRSRGRREAADFRAEYLGGRGCERRPAVHLYFLG